MQSGLLYFPSLGMYWRQAEGMGEGEGGLLGEAAAVAQQLQSAVERWELTRLLAGPYDHHVSALPAMPPHSLTVEPMTVPLHKCLQPT